MCDFLKYCTHFISVFERSQDANRPFETKKEQFGCARRLQDIDRPSRLVCLQQWQQGRVLARVAARAGILKSGAPVRWRKIQIYSCSVGPLENASSSIGSTSLTSATRSSKLPPPKSPSQTVAGMILFDVTFVNMNASFKAIARGGIQWPRK